MTALLAGLAISACFAAPALAAPAQPITTSPRAMIKVRVPVAGAPVCKLSAPGGWARVGTRDVLKVQFRFRVSPRARQGRYRMAARCGRKTTVYRVIVRRGLGDTERLVGSRIRTHLIGSASEAGPTHEPEPSYTVPPEAHAEAQAEWDTSAGARVLAAFVTGECTEWTAMKRPDVIERIWVLHEARALMGEEPPNSAYDVDWTAKYWDDNARGAGLAVGSRPRPGAIAVFEPGVARASRRTGHVAYVERVSGDGTVTISEMNAAAGPGRVDLRAVRPQPGLSFIY